MIKKTQQQHAMHGHNIHPWASAAGGRAPSPSIFIHGIDIVDRGLIVLFDIFWSFFRFPTSLPLEEAFNSAIFNLFYYFLVFFRCPPEKFFCRRPCIHRI